MAQTVTTHTGTLEEIRSQILATIAVKPNQALQALSFVSAPGQVPGPGLCCLCVWKS
jgi:hypothetical protein